MRTAASARRAVAAGLLAAGLAGCAGAPVAGRFGADAPTPAGARTLCAGEPGHWLCPIDRAADAAVAALRARWAWVPDDPASPFVDRWSSLHAALAAGTAPLAGDCEDFAITAVDWLLAHGVPAERLYLAVGFLPGAGFHAFALIERDDRSLVAIDVRFTRPVEAARLPYRAIAVWRADRGWPAWRALTFGDPSS